MHHAAKAALLACATGCAPVPQLVPLTDDQCDVVETKIDELHQGLNLHEKFARSADPNLLFDGEGESGYGGYMNEVQEAVVLVDDLAAKNRIFGYHGNTEEGNLREASGVYFEDEDGSVIALNLDVDGGLGATGAETYLHEGMHQHSPAPHDPEISEATAGNRSEDAVRLVQEARDLPSTGSLLHEMVDEVSRQGSLALEALAFIVDSSTAQGMSEEEISELLHKQPLVQEREAWVGELMDRLMRVDKDILDGYAISKDELRVALSTEVGLYEPIHEAAVEWVARYDREHLETDEARREIRRF